MGPWWRPCRRGAPSRRSVSPAIWTPRWWRPPSSRSGWAALSERPSSCPRRRCATTAAARPSCCGHSARRLCSEPSHVRCSPRCWDRYSPRQPAGAESACDDVPVWPERAGGILMTTVIAHRALVRSPARLRRASDARLMKLVRSGDAAAFEALYDRHHASLLAVCRHMLGGLDEAEDALQHTFLRAHRALLSGQAPAELRPWLFAIARNRCRTLLAARREATPQGGELEPSLDGLIEEVHRRAELRELVADISRLPDEQRGALVLAELGDLSHREIGVALGVATTKVKALVFQAREALVAEHAARATPCAQ